MKTKQRKQLSKVLKNIDKVINHSEDITLSYNIITETGLNETQVIENAIRLFREKLLNILCELDCESEEFKILDDMTVSFKNVLKDKKELYECSVVNINGEVRHETNRKDQMIGILEWALDQIAGNIDMEAE
ncbi:pathogenicity island protein [Staphylococcus sciuri]|uniref:pathogenicity island protein n=1 Tax=Mammaliicoccus sciuri TaxID=1296 RepID=UPI0013E95691|nr:pathogenicity island protein [Mammaliicoccus sciuri]MEB6226834.1 pathogenicity island protein [Mammaliicoccus sciuri]NGX75016.1 pathogenicity island protein [Mammaliicoccus sciuri]